MSTQEKSGGTLSSPFTKGEYTYRRRGSAVATGDIRITDPKSLAHLNIVMDPQPFPRRFLGNIRSMTRIICNQGTRITGCWSSDVGCKEGLSSMSEVFVSNRSIVKPFFNPWHNPLSEVTVLYQANYNNPQCICVSDCGHRRHTLLRLSRI